MRLQIGQGTIVIERVSVIYSHVVMCSVRSGGMSEWVGCMMVTVSMDVLRLIVTVSACMPRHLRKTLWAVYARFRLTIFW